MIDWHAIFVPENSVHEVILRGTLIYFLLFFVLRFFLNRQAGAIGIPDILVVVLVVESTTDALGENKSVTEAAILILTVMFWSYGLQWLAYRFPKLEVLLTSSKVKLIENGKMLRKNMRRELVTEEELMALLRTQGVDDPKNVRLACLESSGDISVVTGEPETSQNGHANKGKEAAI
ncbi:DUF421 domain-containing protein [Tardiphaga alba]|uniref:DUF421 domain-containing protein n=1 Tax=Tardiphaga alba TaxID=340268 RepID=A0ABX8A9X4_9BRAD|nr:YetF domain-containing protein [Tardiphaga alba]QUS39469.1 DUF421 domain-containing protein [Tardiphaga alba]